MLVMAKAQPPRGVRAIEIKPETLEALNRVAKEEGLSQKELVSRALDWFAHLNPQRRGSVLRWAAARVREDIERTPHPN